jgi:1-acyl-sn-glycerol-3-phosphate acyltransferase
VQLVHTLGLYAAWGAGHVALAPWPGARRAWRRRMFRLWGRWTCAALGVRREVVGTPPRAGSFVVCNHLSYLDIPLLASVLGPVFVSKSEIAAWPLFGFLSRSMGTIYVERGRKRQLPDAVREIARALAAGDSVVLFPEGTSTKGERVLEFRPSLLAPAAEGGIDVIGASISYRTPPGDPPASESVCWWGGMEFVPHVAAFLHTSAVHARVAFAGEPVSDRDRKALAEKLWRVVSGQFVPVA